MSEGETTSTCTESDNRPAITLSELGEICAKILSETGCVLRAFVVGKSQHEALLEEFEDLPLHRTAVGGKVSLASDAIARVMGIDVHQIDVPDYFRAISNLDWSTFEYQAKELSKKDGVEADALTLMLEDCQLEYCSEKELT